MKKKILFLTLCVIVWGNVNAQITKDVMANSASLENSYERIKHYPEVGKPMPYFKLKNIQYYYKKTLNTDDLKGKYVILDFGASWCAACFQTYPIIKKLEKKFERKINFFLILSDDEKIRDVYETFKRKQGLEFAVVYDSILFNRFVPAGVPHYIWIDDRGIVKAITGYNAINEDNFNKFSSGESFNFQDKSAKTIITGLVDTNGVDNATSVNPEIFSHSLLEKGNRDRQMKMINSVSDQVRQKVEKIQVYNVFARALYKWAFFDKTFIDVRDDSTYLNYSENIILELADSSLVQLVNNPYRFNYTLILPEDQRNRESYMKAMQSDLERAFGYRASVEKRKMPIWKLQASEEAKKNMKTQRGSPSISGSFAGISLRNQPMKELIINLSKLFWIPRIPIMDETGIDENIDVIFDAIMTDKKDVFRELEKHGLRLVEGEKEMYTIVIRDK